MLQLQQNLDAVDRRDDRSGDRRLDRDSQSRDRVLVPGECGGRATGGKVEDELLCASSVMDDGRRVAHRLQRKAIEIEISALCVFGRT